MNYVSWYALHLQEYSMGSVSHLWGRSFNEIELAYVSAGAYSRHLISVCSCVLRWFLLIFLCFLLNRNMMERFQQINRIPT